MKIRAIKPSKSERIYDLFSSVSVNREDLKRKDVPNSGFYEYPLTHEDISRRLDEQSFSLALEHRGDILAYIISYSLSFARALPQDPVLQKLQDSNPKNAYLDQLFLKPGLPAFVAGRICDAWDHIAQGEKIPGAVCAIPQKPWRNEASTRLVIYRGFRRDALVGEGNIELGVFSKPYMLAKGD